MSENFKLQLYNEYINTEPNRKNFMPDVNKISVHFINGAFVEITGDFNKTYFVEFIDVDTGIIKHSGYINTNMWIRTNIQYHVNWLINVYENNIKIFSHVYNPTNNVIYISLDSKSLGDTIAWFPYINEYRKKYNCTVICSTFWNILFERVYTDIKFISPGDVVHDIYAQFNIGVYGDGHSEIYKNPIDTRNIPLQKIACDILGLEYAEIKPDIYIPTTSNKISKKYVTFSKHSTSQAKYWNNDHGWQTIIDYISNVVDVKSVSKECSELRNVIESDDNNKDILKTIEEISNSLFFIGISSGLSWLAWAIGVPVILISGHTKPFYEFKHNVYRIHNNSVCNGCWHTNDFDKGNWNWCPLNKSFECTKKISISLVKSAIDVLMDHESCYYDVCDIDLKSIKTINLNKQMFVNNYNSKFLKNPNNSNIIMMKEIYMDNLYTDKFDVNKGDIVLDLGANIGIFTRYALKNGASLVYSIEPDINNYTCLCNNVYNSNCVTINKAIYINNDTSTLIRKTSSGGHVLSNINMEYNLSDMIDTIDVESITFDTLISDYDISHINFLKMDIEGSEIDVIYSMTREHFNKIDKIVMEYHRFAHQNDLSKRDLLIKYVLNNGFKHFYVRNLGSDDMIYFCK